MQITTREREERFILGLNGRFDAQGANIVSDALENALRHGWRSIELDMSCVDYLSSAGLRVLLIYYKRLKELKGSLLLAEVQDRIKQVLEIAGLYDLLLSSRPGVYDPVPPSTRTVSFPGGSLEEYELEGNAVLTPRFIGSSCPEAFREIASPRTEVLPFPPSSLSIGIGALGNDEVECRERFGVFMAAGGVAACKPASAEYAADYVVYAEAYIPDLYVPSGLSMTGGFSHLISFACRGPAAVGLRDLAQHMLLTLQTPLIGFLLAAECETAEGLRPAPSASSSKAPPPSLIILACGVMGTCKEKEMSNWLAPWYPGTDLSGHVHAVFFPYQPLRLGFVRLKETVARLFEQELLDLIHVEPHCDGATGQEPIRLQRGVAWFSRIG
jgi:anti-anti-sigma factor